MKKISLKILVILLLVEIFIFNFNSFRVLNDENKLIFTEKDFIYLENSEKNATYIEIKNINTEIKTFHIKLKDTDVVEYKFLYTDETTKELGGAIRSKVYVDTIENSKYMPCYLSGNSHGFAVKIYKGNAQIESMTINEKIPFNFNYTRVILLYLIIISIYLIKTHEIFKQPFHEKNLKQELILCFIVIIFLCIILYINILSREENYDFYCKDFVDAIIKGQTYLEQIPDAKLSELENPYDFSQRRNAGIAYLWDAAFYEGKYYIYFGILPALILMIPYHILTGEYILTATAVLIFSAFSVISLTILIRNIYITFFKEQTFKTLVYSLLITLFGSQVILLNGTPNLYILPIVSGIFFVVTGINFIFLATKKNQIKYKYLFLACLCLATSVACRPTQLISSLIILPLIVKLLIQNIKAKRNIIKIICSVGIPYAVVGISLMLYNYIRFDSIFEFGASYQLTINDMSNLKNRFMVIGMGIICNLFSIPIIGPNFPYIISNKNIMSFYGYYYFESMIGGLFFLVPVIFSIFNIYKIYKHTTNKKLLYFIIILICTRKYYEYFKCNDGR